MDFPLQSISSRSASSLSSENNNADNNAPSHPKESSNNSSIQPAPIPITVSKEESASTSALPQRMTGEHASEGQVPHPQTKQTLKLIRRNSQSSASSSSDTPNNEQTAPQNQTTTTTAHSSPRQDQKNPGMSLAEVEAKLITLKHPLHLTSTSTPEQLGKALLFFAKLSERKLQAAQCSTQELLSILKCLIDAGANLQFNYTMAIPRFTLLYVMAILMLSKPYLIRAMIPQT